MSWAQLASVGLVLPRDVSCTKYTESIHWIPGSVSGVILPSVTYSSGWKKSHCKNHICLCLPLSFIYVFLSCRYHLEFLPRGEYKLVGGRGDSHC